MDCMICGASEDKAVEVHGHIQCVCGRILDGDCCQGETNESCVKTEGAEGGEGDLQDSIVETGG